MWNIKLLFTILFLQFVLLVDHAFTELQQRNKRFLIFPRQAPTRHQFIVGIGIPANLDYESLTIGYVLKAEFWLPWNVTMLQLNPFYPEFSRVEKRASYETNTSTLRWDLYKLIIDRLNSYGYKGMECMLKAICEAYHMKFHDAYDVLHEIMNIFFSPSMTNDMDIDNSMDFREAEKMAQQSSCFLYDCSLSLLDLITYNDI